MALWTSRQGEGGPGRPRGGEQSGATEKVTRTVGGRCERASADQPRDQLRGSGHNLGSQEWQRRTPQQNHGDGCRTSSHVPFPQCHRRPPPYPAYTRRGGVRPQDLRPRFEQGVSCGPPYTRGVSFERVPGGEQGRGLHNRLPSSTQGPSCKDPSFWSVRGRHGGWVQP